MKLLRIPKHRQLLQRLTAARQRASLTQPQLADKVSARPGLVTNYESGIGKEPSRRRWRPGREG